MNQPLVVIHLRLQLHLHTQQVLVAPHDALHLGPHLLQIGLQIQDDLVERGQMLAVLQFGEGNSLLQMTDLKQSGMILIPFSGLKS